MLIEDPIARTQRATEKQDLLLSWLASESWSTVQVMAKLLGASRQSAWKTLKQMQKKGFVRSSDIPLFGKSTLSIWGLTSHGMAYAECDDIKVPFLD